MSSRAISINRTAKRKLPREAFTQNRGHLRLGLKSIPKGVLQLSKLLVLSLADNQIGSIPDSISKLANLRALYLANNTVASIPHSIVQLANLQFLDLRDNKLTSIPDSISGLANLQFLDLAYNQLTSIPDSISQLSNLKYLYLAYNELAFIPDSISLLTNLDTLYLAYNQLTSIPDSISQLAHSHSIWLQGNPLPAEILEADRQGTPQLLAYLRERAASQTPNWRAKLMLVGEGGVGKTNILRRLRNEGFIPNNPPTHNLEIRELDLEHPQRADTTIELRAWDFGGQDFFHATHQFFYTGKSLFLLVWNARDNFEESKLGHWLDRIHALAPGAPVLLVSTHCQHFTPNIPLLDLKTRYPQIVGLFPVDTALDPATGIENLRDTILQQALQLEHMGQPRPTSWIQAGDAIRAHAKPYLDSPAFFELLRENGVKEPEALAHHLNFVGEITFFPRNPIYNPTQPELDDIVILKPDWLLQRISAVLESALVREAKGAFTITHQRSLWKELPKGIQDYLLCLMEHFDLAYRTESEPIRSIVVELCDEDRAPHALATWQHRVEHNQEQQISLEYRFADTTIPPGLPTWFIARSHRLTTPDHHWRRGAVLQDRDHRHIALIQTALDSRKVTLDVRGPLPHNLFSLLRDCFEGTLERFPGLLPKVRRIIPCRVTAECPGFPIETLEKYIERGRDKIECQTCLTEYTPAQLLMGISPSGDSALARLARIESKLDDLQAYQQREFLKIFKREQSLLESHCPPVFTLEIERLPDTLSSWVEGVWNDVIQTPLPSTLTLYCNEPGHWHPVKSYSIQPPAKRLVQLTPLLKKLDPLLAAAKEILPTNELETRVVRGGIEGTRSRLKFADWTDKLTARLERVGEHRDRHTAEALALFELRDLLKEIAPGETDRWGGLIKTHTPQFDYLWLCEEHRRLYR